ALSRERGPARGRRRPVGEPWIVLDQPAEGRLHDHEPGDGLHDLAEAHLARGVLGGAEEDRDDRRDAVAARGYDRGADVLPHQALPLAADGLERAVDAGALFLLATQERDALAVLAETGEHVAVARLLLILLRGGRDEAARDHDHGPAGEHGIDEG